MENQERYSFMASTKKQKLCSHNYNKRMQTHLCQIILCLPTNNVVPAIGQLGEDIVVLEKRLEKKIKVINECEDKINDLEIELAKINSCKHKK